MQIPLLGDIVIIFGLAILGFLLTGVLAGPHGFGLIDAVHDVESLAEIEVVLQHVGVQEARIMVIAIPDLVATRMIVTSARSLNPRLHIITRTRFLQEMKPLYELGANEVIPEEFETSVEIFSRVLARYFIPRDEIETFAAKVRSDGYGMFRSLSEEATTLASS